MEDILVSIVGVLWIELGMYLLYILRKWDKKFYELYEELKSEVKYKKYITKEI